MKFLINCIKIGVLMNNYYLYNIYYIIQFNECKSPFFNKK